ncbi:OmpA family protein [Sphingosinicella sp.]|uniref:OmpA family protein n=1 Tax=Sphingosinicella sp. TaxID=1917971 RepID=UPI0040383347
MPVCPLATLSTNSGGPTQSIIDNAAQTILYVDARLVAIEGYADRRGSRAANIRLSRRRAEAVRAALIARGVPSVRISVRAFGRTTF